MSTVVLQAGCGEDTHSQRHYQCQAVLGLRCRAALGGQQASPGAQHGPHRLSCTTRGLSEKSSCEWAWHAGSAQGTAPRDLSGSAAVIGCFPDQPDAPTCYPVRGNAVTLASESVPRLEHTAAGRPVMTPRHAGLQADDAVASHRAVGGAGPSIEGARTHAHLFSRGAVVGFAAFRAAIEASKNERPRPLDDCFLLR